MSKKYSSKDDSNAQSGTEKFIEKYMSFCYKVLGRSLDLKYDLRKIDEKLRQGDVNVTPGLYISSIALTTFIMTIFGFFLFTFVFLVIIDHEQAPLIILVLTTTLFIASFLTYPFIVSSRISKKKSEIDKELPYTLSELSILASTGLSPVQILRKISKRDDNKFMANEFKKCVYKIDIEGKDIITALSETARETPSEHLKETLWDFSNMIHEGGDLDRYLRDKADEGMELRRVIQKEFIEQISALMELYISLVLMGVLFLSVGAFMIDAMGSSVGGMNGDVILGILTYFLIPLSIIGFSLVISASYTGE
jgi:flagellar protein FlaJ